MASVTPLQEQKLKHALEEQRAQRLRAARETLRRARQEHYAIFAGEGPDVADQANAEELTAFENTLAQRYADAIHDIDAALARMEEHRFGHCVDCGDDIDFGRLCAYPTATRCVRCQEHHDRVYARVAQPTLWTRSH